MITLTLPREDVRNRLTVAFRPLLAIPHVLLVGPPLWTIGGSTTVANEDGRNTSGVSGGLLGILVVFVSIVSWLAIVFTGRHPRSLWDLSRMYLAWRVRSNAYVMLLCDSYPPFGDGPYPVLFDVNYPDQSRNRLTVFFRLLLAIPHMVALALLGIVWLLATIAAWVAILITGRHPDALYTFGIGMMYWTTRYEAYLLLLRDEYPPFSTAPSS